MARTSDGANPGPSRRFRLVALDCDGVLVRQQSAWGTLHQAFGTERAARRNFRTFERGQMDYLEFMRRDISLWGRRSYEEIKRVLLRYDLDPEAESVIAQWRREGRQVAIILRRLAEILGCPLGDTVSVGDSPFDLPVLRASGLGIGYGDRARVGPLAGLVNAWAETFGDVSRIILEFERSDGRN